MLESRALSREPSEARPLATRIDDRGADVKGCGPTVLADGVEDQRAAVAPPGGAGDPEAADLRRRLLLALRLLLCEERRGRHGLPHPESSNSSPSGSGLVVG